MDRMINRRNALPAIAGLLAAPMAAAAQTPEAEPEAVRVLRTFLERVFIGGDVSVVHDLVAPDLPAQYPGDVDSAAAFAQRLTDFLRNRTEGGLYDWRERIVWVGGCETVAAGVTFWQQRWDADGNVRFQGNMVAACTVENGRITRWWHTLDAWHY